MSICLQGSVANLEHLLWFEDLIPNQARMIAKIMCNENLSSLEPLSMNTFEDLIQFIAGYGKLSDKIEEKGSLDGEGFGWVKTFNLLIKLCDLAQKHECFDEDKAKLILKECLKELSSKGFDINAPLLWQDTKPLHKAAQDGCAVLCNVLIELGANIEEPKTINSGKTPLHVASRARKTDVIRGLIKLGANVNASAKDNCIGRSDRPIHEGAYYPEVVQILWENGANINAVSKDTIYGPTAFYKAVKGGRPEATQKLLDLGAKVDENDYENVRNAVLKNIAWHANAPSDCHKKNIRAWTNTASTIVSYINTLIILNKHQFQSHSLESIKFCELNSDTQTDIKFSDLDLLKRKIREINDSAQEKIEGREINFWLNKTQILHKNAVDLIQVIKKYTKV